MCRQSREAARTAARRAARGFYRAQPEGEDHDAWLCAREAYLDAWPSALDNEPELDSDVTGEVIAAGDDIFGSRHPRV